jgi:hypothetical protein
MKFKKKQKHKAPPENKDEASIRIVKFIAPKIMDVCGKSSVWTRSPCECTDIITCAYCVQASLLFFEANIKASDEKINKILSTIKRTGIRKTARELNVDHSTVKYWIKTKNFPQWVVEKLCRGG